MKSKKHLFELTLCLTLGLVVFLLASSLEFFESKNRAAETGFWEAEEFVLLLLSLLGGFGLFNWHRLRALLAQSQLTQQNEVQILLDRQKTDHAKNLFFNTLGHSLRSPLGAVNSITQLLQQPQSLDADGPAMVEALARNTGELNEVVANLLEYVELESTPIVLVQEPFGLIELLNNQVNPFANLAAAKGLLFYFDVPTLPKSLLLGDPQRLALVLRNLLSNALNFTEDGQICLAVAPPPHSLEGQISYEFKIIDSGMGVNQRGPLFDSAHLSPPSTSGTGLGILIARQIIQAMGGKLKVEPAPQGGSIFSFTLSFAKGPNYPTPPLNVLRTLVYEPNPGLASVAHKALTFGVCCQQEQTFLNLATQGNFDQLVIEGFFDPEKGLDLARQLAERIPHKPRLFLKSPRFVLAPEEAHWITSAQNHPLPVGFFNDLNLDAKEQKSATPLGPRVLLVDSNPTDRTILGRHLQALGAQVTLANSGSRAIIELEDRPYDLMLIDLDLPEMNGRETLAMIKKRISAPMPKTVGISKLSEAEGKFLAKSMAIDGFLAKPVTLSGITELLIRLNLQSPPKNSTSPLGAGNLVG